MSEEIITTTVDPIVEPVVAITPENTPVIPAVKTEVEQPNLAEVLANADEATLMKLTKVQKILEGARQQEKNKLYQSLEGKDTTINELKQKVTDLEKQLNAKGEETLESEKELLAQIQSLKEGQDALLADIAREKKELAEEKLEAFRKAKIEAAEGKLIVGLVSGTTEEEITSSIEAAKAEYQKIVAPFAQQAEEAAKPNVLNAPRASNPGTGGTPAVELTSEQIKKMTPAEYREHREKLLSAIRG